MKMSGAFPSDYLKASDLVGREVKARMSHVEIREVGREKEHKPVLYFEGKEKGLVLNKTNANVIAKGYGDESDNWAGKEIILFEAEVQFGAETVPGIRVKLPAKPKPTLGEEMNDEVPW